MDGIGYDGDFFKYKIKDKIQKVNNCQTELH